MNTLIAALYRNEKASKHLIRQGTTPCSLLANPDCRFTRPDDSDSRQASNYAVLSRALLLQDLQIMLRERVVPKLRGFRS